LTAYVGLAPVPRESGRSVRGRPSIGHDGNGRLRTALYMATLSAARYNPAVKAFHARLRAAGKPPKVARCAAARKLLHPAWGAGIGSVCASAEWPTTQATGRIGELAGTVGAGHLVPPAASREPSS